MPTTSKIVPPLAGLRILVGRAKSQASALSAELEKLGAKVVAIPFIEIRQPRSFRPLDEALRNIAEYDWLILTSANGAEALWSRVSELGIRKQKLNHLQIAAIGPATAQAITCHGLDVDIVPAEYIAESVVRSLRKLVRGKRVLLVRAKVARDVIPVELRKAGAEVTVVEAYETVTPAASKRRLKQLLNKPEHLPHIITFTSSSTVKNFVALIGKPAVHSHKFADVQFASIGPVTSTTLRSFGLKPHITAKEFTIPGLIAAIVRSNRKAR